MTDTSVMEAARRIVETLNPSPGHFMFGKIIPATEVDLVARALIRMHAAMTEIANLKMGRGDGVVGDYIESVQEIAAAALSDESGQKS